jgi:response regulator of citrate/malate metabolism
MSAWTIRTLIVDDDPEVRRLHARYLAGIEGFVLVDSVGRGEAAAAVAARADVDLVLLDINLPGYSGVEVLHRLRETRGGGVDVYVISSARDRHTVRQAVSARVVGFLTKPFTEEAFVRRLTAYRDARIASEPRPGEAGVPLGQGEIDKLVAMVAQSGNTSVRAADAPGATAGAGPAIPAGLPKGIAAPTLDAIRTALDPWRPATALEIAAATGASRATVRRYLDHLVDVGAVDVSHRFGRRGRPEVLYRLAPAPD